MVSPISRFRSFSTFITCAWIDTSSAEIGSSAITIVGSTISARAMPILWRCPPDSFETFVFAYSPSPTLLTLKNQKAEQDKLGFNDYFRNYSEDRVVLKKEDGSAFTAEDLAAIADTANIKSVVQADIMLDDPVYIEQGDLAYAGYPRPISEFRGTLAAGVMPEAENEVILEAYEDGIDPSTVEDDILGKTFRITLEEDCNTYRLAL